MANVGLLAPVPGPAEHPLSAMVRPMLGTMTRLLKHLADATVQQRLQRQLSAADLKFVNDYRARVIEFVHKLIMKFTTIRAQYKMFIQHREVVVAQVLQALGAISIEDDLAECHTLIKDNSQVQQLVKESGDLTFIGFLVENKWALVACAVGVAMCVLPGAQFGIPPAIELTLAIAGGTIAATTSLVVAATNSFNESTMLQSIQERLGKLQTEMQHFRTQLCDIQAKKTGSQANENTLTGMAVEMETACTDIIQDATDIETLALKLPLLAKSSSCVIL